MVVWLFCQEVHVHFKWSYLIVYYATRFINGTLDTSFMLGTSEAYSGASV
jgi:hypothetical protein